MVMADVRRAGRCQRPDCRGSIIRFGDGERCLLCGRGRPERGSTAPDLHLAALAALMGAPGAPFRTIRAGPALALGEHDDAPPKGSKTAEIAALLDGGWSQAEIVAEGRHRRALGGPGGGWSQPTVNNVATRLRRTAM